VVTLSFRLSALLVLAALGGCRSDDGRLTIALALLPSELPAYREVVADFEREAGRRVIVVPQQYADIRRALAAEASAGRGTLDLVELDVYSLAPSAAHVTELDPAVLATELSALVPQAADAGRMDGRLRFLPHRVSWQALIYNHSVLDRPPANWSDLIEVARRHSRKIAFKAALYEGLACDLLPFIWAAGGSGERFDDPGTRTAFELFAELAPHLHPQSAIFKEATIAEAMARGELVLHLNWPFVMSLYQAQGLAPGTIRSAPLPNGPRGTATVLGGGYIAIPRSAPHPEAALGLARFLLRQQVQRRLGERLGWFSARHDVAVQNRGDLLAGFQAMRSHVRPRPERADYPRLSRAWQQAFRAVAFEGTDVDAALRRAARGFQEEGS
jgi:ABC-type glycerol-3-phosphate transport system substrate-binding protein